MAAKRKGTLIETPNEASFSGDLPEWFTTIDPPYSVSITIEGTKPYLFNRYNGDLEDTETAAARRVKKAPPIESRLTVDSEGFLAASTEQIRMAIAKAGTNYRNPRAKSGSLGTVLREGLVSESDLCSFGVKDWEFQDTRRARHSSSFVTKVRPGLLAGWTLSCQVGVLLPQYIVPRVLHQCLVDAGRIGGIGDARILGFGRFIPTHFEVLNSS